jgi:hypothetical protein
LAADEQPQLRPSLRVAAKFRYVFLGNHALSGERYTIAILERFFERVFRLFPDANFEVMKFRKRFGCVGQHHRDLHARGDASADGGIANPARIRRVRGRGITNIEDIEPTERY